MYEPPIRRRYARPRALVQKRKRNFKIPPNNKKYILWPAGTIAVFIVLALALGASMANSSDGRRGSNPVELHVSDTTGSSQTKSTDRLPTDTPPPSGTSANNHTSQDKDNPAGNQTRLTVNGQDIHVPSNGSVHKTITDNSGNSRLDVSVQSSQSGTTQQSSSSSTSIQVDSFSETSDGSSYPSHDSYDSEVP